MDVEHTSTHCFKPDCRQEAQKPRIANHIFALINIYSDEFIHICNGNSLNDRQHTSAAFIFIPAPHSLPAFLILRRVYCFHFISKNKSYS